MVEVEVHNVVVFVRVDVVFTVEVLLTVVFLVLVEGYMLYISEHTHSAWRAGISLTRVLMECLGASS